MVNIGQTRVEANVGRVQEVVANVAVEESVGRAIAMSSLGDQTPRGPRGVALANVEAMPLATAATAEAVAAEMVDTTVPARVAASAVQRAATAATTRAPHAAAVCVAAAAASLGSLTTQTRVA